MSTRRDYKRTATGQRHRKTVRRHGLLVITLILIGLFGGLLAYIKGDRTRLEPVAATPAVSAPMRAPSNPTAKSPPKAIDPAGAEPAPIKPKYDFYTELPKRQIEIQREDASPRNAPQTLPPRTQPAVDPLRKPAAPHKNATKATVAASPASGSTPQFTPPTLTKPASAPPKPAQPLARESTIIVKNP